MCPNKTADEWKWQKQHAPGDFAKAVQFEKEIQLVDEDLWLTQAAKPLDTIEFEDHPDMFTGLCDSGMCFV
jgi:hypothetical protein